MGLRVLIVDDLPLFVDAIEPTVRRLGASEVHRAHTGAEAVAEVLRREIDVAMVDIGLPDRSGFVVGTEILALSPATRVVALTALKDPAAARYAIEAGFSGYVVKDVSLEEFEMAVKEVFAGGTVTSLLPASKGRHGAWNAEGLTERELEVLRLLVAGASGRTIASRLGISRNTVRTHIQSILGKLQVHSRLEATAFAVQNGLVNVAPPTGDERRRFA